MGYNSLSHYTSLTSRDYMYMMKQLGYSSYWMEVGSYGGTELTDALLSVKYLIEKNTGSADAVYSNDTYEIVPTEYYLPLGIVTDADLSGSEELSTGTRSNVQKKLFEQLSAATVTSLSQTTNTPRSMVCRTTVTLNRTTPSLLLAM